jgi:hypothetical protein
VNFLVDEGEDRIRQACGAEKYERLRALERKYDRQLLPPEPGHPPT